jgi:hypothetical protein
MRGRDITELFAKHQEPEEEARRIKLCICYFLMLYIKALEMKEELHLRNHISLWLIISTLLETS